MKNPVIRIESFELINFKNVKHGFIDFKNNLEPFSQYEDKGDVIGIYGQNGSGKTAVVEAFQVLQLLLTGDPLPVDIANYMYMKEDYFTLKFNFYMRFGKLENLISYEVNCIRNEDNEVFVNNEKLSCVGKDADRKSRKMLVEYDLIGDTVITPRSTFDLLISDTNSTVNLRVARKMAIQKKTSFIFGEDFFDILYSNKKTYAQTLTTILALTYFAKVNLIVINTQHNAAISLDFCMPVSFRIEEEQRVSTGNIQIMLTEPSLVTKEVFDILHRIVKQMNIVLEKIIPGLKLELHDYGEQLDGKGNQVIKVELLSVKKQIKLPLSCESEGILKIISIMNSLIAMYNNPSICMVVDELDSGIYEYLLGEILSVIESGSKGQIIFTSHNLRPLEVLNKDSLYFTTTNPEKRYIRMKNVKANNNLRSMYIRSINLGGQNEELYKETDDFEIQRAFRLAGE